MVVSPMSKGLTLRDEQKRLTPRRLIDGALAAFERKGYAATTIEDVVAEANASRATFYLHFKSKSDLVLVMAQTLGRRWRDLYRELTAGERLSRKELYEWLDAMSGHYRTNRATVAALAQAAAVEAAGAPPRRARAGRAGGPRRPARQPAGEHRGDCRVAPALVRGRRGGVAHPRRNA